MVFDANMNQILSDAKQKEVLVKKENIRVSNFMKRLGNANQNRMSVLVVRCFLLCEAVFAPDWNEEFMYDSEPQHRCQITGMTCLQLFEVVAANDKVAVRGFVGTVRERAKKKAPKFMQ